MFWNFYSICQLLKIIHSVASYISRILQFYSQFSSIIWLFLFYFSRLYRTQFETRVQFDAATRLRSDIPFGPILNLIDARSISIIGARFPFSRSVLDARLLMLATRVPLMSLTRVVTDVYATIIVLRARWLPIFETLHYSRRLSQIPFHFPLQSFSLTECYD